MAGGAFLLGRYRVGKNGRTQTFDLSVVPKDLRDKLLMSKFDLPLRYLHYRRLINTYRPGRMRHVRIAVTFAGADRAMRLHTRLGRMEVWYQEHRDGFMGLLITIAVSFVTALAVVGGLRAFAPDVAEPPRIIYEVDPKSQP